MAEINALPVPYLGTGLDDNAVCTAIGLCFGADIVEEHAYLWHPKKGIHGGRLNLGKSRLTYNYCTKMANACIPLYLM